MRETATLTRLPLFSNSFGNSWTYLHVTSTVMQSDKPVRAAAFPNMGLDIVLVDYCNKSIFTTPERVRSTKYLSVDGAAYSAARSFSPLY